MTEESLQRDSVTAPPKTRRRWVQIALWGVFLGYFSLLLLALINQFYTTGTLSPDFATYQIASDAIANGESPYLSVEETREIWLSINAITPEMIVENSNAATVSGSYVYLPTLALMINRFTANDAVFNAALMTTLLTIALIGFSWLLLREGRNHAIWLLLIVVSAEVTITIAGGNAEMLLMLCALGSAWLIWQGKSWWAIPLIAFAALIKPFYVFFFASFGLILLANNQLDRRKILVSLVIAATGSLILIGIDVAFWGDFLRSEALIYVQNSLDYAWFNLPLESQSPLNIWNRSAMQGFINAGLDASLAQQLSIVTWMILLGVTLWRSYSVKLSFRLCFALALVLFYWVRPVGWGFVFLEVVILLAVWAYLKRWERIGLTLVMVVLALSRWVVLGQTGQGQSLNLFTLHSAEFPWEIWLLLPGCWLILIFSTWRAKQPTT